MISASAPAGMASRTIGRLAATCTRETISGSGLRLVISQLDAAAYIHVPILAARLAVQITVKSGWRNGLQAEARGGRAAGPLARTDGLWSSLDKRSVRVASMALI
jgi:hypothetical protein